MTSKGRVRALVLLSGGLDSLLAVKIIQEQGIEVTGLTFVSPFFGSKNAKKGAEQLGIDLKIIDFTEDHLKMVKNPPHGYGKQMNPCIDCHALMIRKAGELLEAEGIDFIATGEVLGERPMSQNMQSLGTVARDSGYADLLVRPLSAKLLKTTKPELEGLIDRERLLAISGRSRKPQMALAEKYGIKSYVQPAGGCLLTDVEFSKRLRELLRKKPDATERDVRLLRYGRHFRLESGAKVIVGRDERDNESIEGSASRNDALIVSDVIPGPTAIVVGGGSRDDIEAAAEICASYSDHGDREVDMELRVNGEHSRVVARPKKKDAYIAIKI